MKKTIKYYQLLKNSSNKSKNNIIIYIPSLNDYEYMMTSDTEFINMASSIAPYLLTSYSCFFQDNSGAKNICTGYGNSINSYTSLSKSTLSYKPSYKSHLTYNYDAMIRIAFMIIDKE